MAQSVLVSFMPFKKLQLWDGWNDVPTRVDVLRTNAGTLRVCSFFAGMNGKPFGGVLFNHVPFFSGEDD
jgi:hypothetical protein